MRTFDQITELSPAQTEYAHQAAEDWRKPSWFTSKIERATVESAVRALYEHIKVSDPKFVWCPSPPALLKAALSSGASPHDLINEAITRFMFHDTVPAIGNQATARLSDDVRNELEKIFVRNLRWPFDLYWNFMGELPSMKTITPAGASKDTLKKFERACWVPQDLYWLAKHDFARKRLSIILFDERTTEVLDMWLTIAQGTSACLFFDDTCYIADRPSDYNVDERGRLHNDRGPALKFSNDDKLYATHGLLVPENVIEDPKSITLKQIADQRNAEVRRVLIETYGTSRFLVDAKAKKLDDSEFGTLYSHQFNDDEAIVMVRVRNSTPEPAGYFKYYWLRVPPNITTAHEAVAWTFELDAAEYRPKRET